MFLLDLEALYSPLESKLATCRILVRRYKNWELKDLKHENTQTPKFKSNKPWNTESETHKTDQNTPITNHKPWPFEPVGVNFCFPRGPLRWLMVAQSLQILIYIVEKPKIQKQFLQHRSCTIQNSCKKIYIHCCHSEPETGDFPWLLWAWPLATCNLISHLLCTCSLYGFQLEILVSDSPDIVSCTFFSLWRWCFILLYIVFVMHLLYLIFFRSTMVQFCSLKALKTLMVGHCLLNPTF